MALSAAARAALEQFRAQQTGGATGTVEMDDSGFDNGNGNGNGGLSTLSPAPSFSSPTPTVPTMAPAPTDGALRGLSGKHQGLFRPEQPKSFKDCGVSYRVLEGLVLKIIKQEGPQNVAQLGELLKLSINVFQDVVQSLLKRELLDTPMPMHYDLTTRGREFTTLIEREDAYVGPAPVAFKDYCSMCQQQAKRERRVTIEDVDEVFSDYPMRPELKRMLKEGFNSQGPLLFYGPPGNGKSLITDNLHRLLKDPVVLPYCFEFNGKVVQLYDPAFHKLRDDLMKQEEEESSGSVSTAGKPDRRWLISAPPLVTVGTEFKVSHFEISFDGQYFAPPQVKANNGIFIFDDLGRQTEDHNMILNQFIYPLEQRESIVKFTGGSAMRAPFLERLFLSTNLNHQEILDDAFKRRLLYQVLVDRPTVTLWKDIFRRIAAKNGIEPQFAVELGDILVRWYKEDSRVIRAVDPRNIFKMIDATLDEGQSASEVLDMEMFRRIYDQYPAAYKHEAKEYVGAMDTIGEGDAEE